MARVQVVYDDNAFRRMASNPVACQLVAEQVQKTMAHLDSDDYGYAENESGGDRVRGAVWTRTGRAKARTARHGELLRALTS